MLIRKFRYLFSTVLITAIIIIFDGCSYRAYKVELPEKLPTIDEIAEEELPVYDEVIISATDIITQLYEKSDKLLSTSWNSRENLYQMLFVLHTVYRGRS